eukprot:gene8094-8287_t
MTDEELRQALPSMLFTTGNLIWSSKWSQSQFIGDWTLAELEAQMQELQQLPRTADVKKALAEVKAELRQYQAHAAAWWKWW